jgi:hypothetical protein
MGRARVWAEPDDAIAVVRCRGRRLFAVLRPRQDEPFHRLVTPSDPTLPDTADRSWPGWFLRDGQIAVADPSRPVRQTRTSLASLALGGAFVVDCPVSGHRWHQIHAAPLQDELTRRARPGKTIGIDIGAVS